MRTGSCKHFESRWSVASLGVFSSYPAAVQTEFDWRQPTHSFERRVQTETAGLDTCHLHRMARLLVNLLSLGDWRRSLCSQIPFLAGQSVHHSLNLILSSFTKRSTATTTIFLRPLWSTTCISWHFQLRTGGFCWSKVSLPTCPCWQQLVHSD